jgi:hypothetical protein
MKDIASRTDDTKKRKTPSSVPVVFPFCPI